MATTQVADVSVYPKKMDAPKEVQEATNNTGWLSGWVIAGFGAAMAWIGNQLFKWLLKKGEAYVLRIESAVKTVESFMALIKEIMKTNEEIIANQKQILERISELELQQAKIKGKIGLE
jgi:hypothetical protein